MPIWPDPPNPVFPKTFDDGSGPDAKYALIPPYSETPPTTPPSVGLVGDIAAEALSSTAAAGTTGRYADAGHKHAMPGKTVAVPLAASGVGAAGTSNVPALDDHVHPAVGASVTTGGIALTGNVNLPNGAFADVLSLALAAGTWVVMSVTTVNAPGGAAITMKVWDGATVFGSAEFLLGALMVDNITVITPPFVLAAPTTVKVSGASNGAGNDALASVPTNGGGAANTATNLVAIKVA